MRPSRSLFWMFASLASLAGPLTGHGDLKRAHAKPPYLGPGYRNPLGLDGRPVQIAPPRADAGGSSCGTFSCERARLLSWLSLPELGADAGNDCWGYTSPSGREYALMGLSNGTAVVEISDPGSPNVVATLAGPSSTWRDMKVFEHYLYVVSEGGDGIQIFDLDQVDTGVVAALGNVTTGGSTATHNVAIDEESGFLYRCRGSGNGLRIYDLNADPTNPPFVANWPDRQVHDAQVFTYTSGPYAGRQIAFCTTSFAATLAIVDVTDKSNMFVRDEVSWTGSEHGHQNWLSSDGRYVYVNDEFDEPPLPTTTHVVDVADLDDVFYTGSFTNGLAASSHNLYVDGSLVYEANYRSGLRVYDTAADPINAVEVAHFDTVPEDDDAGFNGLWSCYPFFPSGVVIGSDRERGLFVWWVGDPALEFDFPGGMPFVLGATNGTLRVRIEEVAGTVEPGSPTLHYDAGAGLVSLPLVSLGGDLYEAQFGALPCDQAIDFYVTALTTNQILWASPENAPAATWQAYVQCGESYCTAKTNSCGTLPVIGALGAPSSAASAGFVIHASGARANKSGILLYTDAGRAAIPFEGGTLCVAPPIRRAPAVVSSGGAGGSCSAQFELDMNAFASGQLGGNPQAYLLLPGTIVGTQWWGRDTVAAGSFLSDGFEYTVAP